MNSSTTSQTRLEATIVTMHDAEEISVAGGGVIHVVPAWAWMLGV